LMQRILQIGAPEKDALILDSFAGSGTTAQAVLQMNRADGGARRFVLLESNLASDICAKRVRAVIEGYHSAKYGTIPGVEGDFAYLKADPA
jgi:adenine-specific DNA-methyltransferase